jgi:hypothetical protein
VQLEVDAGFFLMKARSYSVLPTAHCKDVPVVTENAGLQSID